MFYDSSNSNYNRSSYYNMVLTNKFKEERTKQFDHMFNGFSFKKKHEKIDWRKLAALDIEKVTKELDFDTLQDNIDHITFCSIESEIDARMIDPNFLKLFKLSQLTIEYLLQSQNYLAQVITDNEILLRDSQLELDELKKNYDKVRKDLFDLKKENKKRKKLIEEQQAMININQANYHKCAYCSKAFLNLIYLQSHINRRHAQMNTQQKKDPEVEKELEKIKEKLRQTENELYLTKQSMTNINNIKDNDFLKKMEAWKTDQIRKHNHDLENVKENVLRETNELKSKLTASENIINELRIRLGTQSNVGWIKDDVDLEKDTVLKQKYELDNLKIKLHSNDENYTKQLEELNKLDKRNKKQLNKYKKDLTEKDSLIEKLNAKISKLSAEAHIKKEQGTEHIKAYFDENDNARNSNPPPPITPRTTGRSPSPTKSNLVEHREQHHNRLSTIYMCLPEYCPKTKEILQEDENYLEFYREEIRRRFIEQLDEIGIRIDDKKLSKNDFKSKNKDILIYRNSVAAEFKHFNHMRKVFSDASDQITKKRLESSLRSSSGTNRVKFEDNLIKRPKNDLKTLNSIKRPDISASKLLDSYNRQNIKNDSETTNDEVSIPNALESNDDDTEPTKQNFNVNQHNKNKNIIKLPENYGKLSNNYEDEASELESITQIQESNEKHKTIGYVKGVAKTIDKELEQISKKGTKPGINAVPIGFHESKLENQESNDSISSLELTENSKNQKNTKLRNQISLDTSTNTSVWASVSHGVNNANFNQNNNHLQHNQNMSSRNEIERPATANSALTSNFDSDEFDYMP